MKIAFLHKGFGHGGTDHQAELLRHGLQKLGHKVALFSQPTDLSNFEIAFIPHLNIPDTELFYHNCKKYNIPYVVKTIWSVWGIHDFVYQVAKDASVLFAESPEEKNILIDKLSHKVDNIGDKIEVVLPAVDPVFKDKGLPVNERFLVHSNGRYVPKKCMADVVRACKDLKLPVCISGFPQSKEYYEECLDIGYGEVCGELGKQTLCDVLNRTRLYVSASEIEVCSASVSEAIACGCKILSSNKYHPGNSNFDKNGYFIYDGCGLHKAMEEAYYSSCVQENKFWSVDMLAKSYNSAFMRITKKFKFL